MKTIAIHVFVWHIYFKSKIHVHVYSNLFCRKDIFWTIALRLITYHIKHNKQYFRKEQFKSGSDNFQIFEEKIKTNKI